MHSQTAASFGTREQEILREVQGTLPDSPAPFASIARKLDISEEQVLDLLRELKDRGVIRRFGATLRHQEAGYDCNVMVAWHVPSSRDMEEVSRIMCARSEITHVYQRRTSPEWPFDLYTMVHGRSEADCREVVRELQDQTGLEQCELLFSHQELKKTSMQYF
ncbi:Lrp/AsnC family transcriptional regulator [Desulfovermiculus halophilus]|uniref:siroheme decarboxylase subunit beta n=1 Tax=Desulfovermiculus halophilus TaxID=339722 RepID=UPI00047F6E9A|nr:Lrp/AsnC family transcriptional regulator [Desulfovermiculus halophilus]